MDAKVPSSIKLNYFWGRAKGELIRYIFNYAQVPFVDNRIQFEGWPELKNSMRTKPHFSSV